MSRFLIYLLASCLGASAFAAGDPDIFIDGEAPPKYFSIGRMPKPPPLDGSLAGWPADAATFLLGQNTQTGRRLSWNGTKDCSGEIWLAWDAHYLYLAADICDDQLCQATSGADFWQGDTLELFFNTYPRQQRVDGFWQEAIAPPLVSGVQIKAVGPQKDFTGVEGTAQTHPGSYTMECKIPWKNLGGFSPELGTAIGFQLYVDDRDGKGRHGQLYWYPSAISFSRPTHTNILLLRDRGDTASPQVLAGPSNWSVTDPDKMTVSAITSAAGATTATVTLIPPFPEATPPATPPSVSFDLQKTGERVSIGQGVLPVTGLDGLHNFEVRVMDGQGRTLAANSFQAELVGTNFRKMQAYAQSMPKRLAADKLRPDIDPAVLAGLNYWYMRLGAFVNNEGHPSSLNRSLLDKMVDEFGQLDGALTDLEAGKDPYAGRTGSFVRAYKSPLTGQLRGCALYVPADYDPKSGKKYPLIVLLHSIFADERMLSLLADNFKDLGAIVCQAPSYRQFDWGGVSAAETWAGLDEVKRLYPIDEDRVYLIGYHIGGRGTWQLAEARPDQWAAIAPIFAGIDTGPHYPALRLYPQYYADAINVRIPPPQFVAPPEPAPITDPLLRKMYEQDSLATRVDNIASLPVRSSYGESEPNARAERMAMQDRLTKLGFPLSTRYVPGAMHGSGADEFNDPAFYQWLLSFRRGDYPKQVSFVATGLRDHAAWWVSVDQLASPEEVARIDASLDGSQITVKTAQASAISLLIDDRLAAAGTALSLQVDGQALPPVTAAANAPWLHFVRGTDGKWAAGGVPDGQKQPGLSGPIDDYQRDRFMVVYGTGGDTAAQKKLGMQIGGWGLGADFEVKADTDVTDDDVHNATLLLVGTPSNNSQLAKIAGQLPLKWTATGFQLGKKSVEGPGAGACFVVPNPLSTGHYVVVITATDDNGYQVWSARDPGGDYVLGHVVTTSEGKPSFVTSARGWFTNAWQWSGDLCLKPVLP